MRRTRRVALLGVAAALALLAALGVLHWRHAARAAPRELIVGGHEPAAPRVTAQLESLDAAALESAAQYAAEHGSRALMVSRHEHIVFERYWQGSSFDTLADAQGFTPLLAVLATGAALSHRRLGWPDEPLAALISEWSADARGTVTLRNLLQSSSGLSAPPAERAPADLSAAALAARLSGAPGGTRREQPLDAQLLALILERATHERYAAFLSESLWRRLGAADAWLSLDRPGGTAHADCCLLARQGDWIRVAQLLLHDGNYRGDEVIRPGWVTLMRSPARADPRHGAYLELAAPAVPGREAYAARDLFLVGGAGGNRMWLVPALQLAIVRLGDAVDPTWQDTRIPNLVIRAVRDAPPPAQPGTDVSSLVPGHTP
jgi:CubicO group peptidase (beta-lactamase class C family)